MSNIEYLSLDNPLALIEELFLLPTGEFEKWKRDELRKVIQVWSSSKTRNSMRKADMIQDIYTKVAEYKAKDLLNQKYIVSDSPKATAEKRLFATDLVKPYYLRQLPEIYANDPVKAVDEFFKTFREKVELQTLIRVHSPRMMKNLKIVHPENPSFFQLFEIKWSAKLKEFYTADNNDYRAKLKARHSNITNYDREFIIEWLSGMTDRIEAEDHKLTWQELALYLGLVTGKRQGEILGTATFKPIGDYEMLFEGQLKKPEDDADEVFEITTLARTSVIMNALELLELEGNRGLDLKKINGTYSNKAKKGIEDIYNKMGLENFKASREVMAKMLSDNYAAECLFSQTPETFSPIGIVSKQLGHNDTGVADSYMALGWKKCENPTPNPVRF